MNPPVLETGRLVLRPVTTSDAAFIVELLNTEGWLKNIGDRGVRTEEEAVAFIEGRMMKMYEDHHLGSYIVELKEGKISVGTCGLVHRDFLDQPDIGYAFLPGFMGKGYAIEAALAVKNYAIEVRKQSKLYAFCLPANTPSVRVLTKLGLSYVKEFVPPGETETLHLYALEA